MVESYQGISPMERAHQILSFLSVVDDTNFNADLILNGYTNFDGLIQKISTVYNSGENAEFIVSIPEDRDGELMYNISICFDDFPLCYSRLFNTLQDLKSNLKLIKNGHLFIRVDQKDGFYFKQQKND